MREQIDKPPSQQVKRLDAVVRISRACQLAGLLACGFVALLSGCQTERVTTSDGWQMPPQPRETPVPPAGLMADRMLFMVGSKPDDTDNNGFPDTIRASVALFSIDHPTALREEGAFTFMLYPRGRSAVADGKPIAQWRVEGDALRETLATAQYGPCYQFVLSLLQTPLGDRLPREPADMICRFEPASGAAPVTSAGARSLQIGGRVP